MPSSARIVATATGCVMYGSPLLRSWPRCARSATTYACSTTARSAFGWLVRAAWSTGSIAGNAAPLRAPNRPRRERIRLDGESLCVAGTPVSGVRTSSLITPPPTVEATVYDRAEGGTVTGRRCRGRSGHRDEHVDRAAGQLVAPAERLELHEERQPDDLGAAALQEGDRGRRRAAGGQDVVDDQHAGARRDGVRVDLDRRRPVLELVRLRGRRTGKLAGLAHREHPG